ncbi:MAG: DoxX family protein [Chthoniobacterales bacterium]
MRGSRLQAGIWFPALPQPAAIGMGLMMLGAIAMHLKIKDPLMKALPAFCVLVLCALIAFLPA